jgi:hypothetical protein
VDPSSGKENTAPTWRSLGPHRFAVDGDLLLWSPQGEISEKEGDLISDEMVRIFLAKGYVLILIDGRNSPPLRYEVRRIYAEKLKRHKIRVAVGVYGGKPASRVIATLIVHAARLMSGVDMEIRCTATEAESRKFLDGKRERFLISRSA